MEAGTLARNAALVFVGVALAGWGTLQFTPLGRLVKGDTTGIGVSVPTFASPGAELAAEPPRFRDINPLSARQRVLVLMYHDVVPSRGPGTVWYDETVAGLRETLRFIRDNGGTVITVEELHRHLTEGAPVPERAVVITFDDNYQGVGEYAAPVLDEFEAPFAVYVHTDFVGVKDKGRPKMTWEELRNLREHYRATIGSHTASHPEDITLLEPESQRQELVRSMEAIRDALGEAPTSIAWANGKHDEVTLAYAKSVGYRMGFAMASGPAQTSPSILAVRRYPFTKFRQGWDERERALERGLDVLEARWSDGPVRVERWARGRARFAAAVGGRAVTSLADRRALVTDFVQRLGGVAGINGTFFALSALASDDNQMIGPVVTADREGLVTGYSLPDPNRLRDRPLVVWGPERVAFVPYQPESMNREEVLRELMPDLTNVFLGGAWLVRDGVAMGRADILALGPADAMDARRRVLFGVTRGGAPVCMASTTSVTSAILAEAAAEFGVAHAVLLDSGYSTSLVVGEEVLASGHATRERPSRPVPHAIVLQGTLAVAGEDSPLPRSASAR